MKLVFNPLTGNFDFVETATGSYQPLDATLTSLSALGTAADKIAYTTGIDTWAETTITSAARLLIGDAAVPRLSTVNTWTRQNLIDGSADETTLRVQPHSTMGASSFTQTWESATGTRISAVSASGNLGLGTDPVPYAQLRTYKSHDNTTLAALGFHPIGVYSGLTVSLTAADFNALTMYGGWFTVTSQASQTKNMTRGTYDGAMTGGRFEVSYNTTAATTAALIHGGVFDLASGGAATVTTAKAGKFSATLSNTSTIGTLSMAHLASPSKAAGATLTTLYGLYVEDMTAGGTSYAIKTNRGDIALMSNAADKFGLWGVTPIAQPTTAIAAATLTGGGGTGLTDTDTFDGYTLKQVVKALRNLGVLA